MSEKELIQFKVISLQAANGNLDNAKLIYDWLITPVLDQVLDERQAFRDRLVIANTAPVVVAGE